MSVTPRRSWPAGEGGATNAGGNDSQRMPHPGAQSSQQGNRQLNMANSSHPNAIGGAQSILDSSAKSGPTPIKPTMTSHQQQQQQLSIQQQQQQQQRALASSSGNSLPPTTSSLFSPSSSAIPSMSDMHQQNQFVNGQGDMTQSGTYSANSGGLNHGGMAHNNSVKSESHYDFSQHSMNDFDAMQMSSDSLFNALAQTQSQQLPSHMQLGDVKSMPPSTSSPNMSMPPALSGKPKSHSASQGGIRNASSWSSLAGSSQMGGPGGSSKASNAGDSFQMFKRQAKEKEARQKLLMEQQELRRQQKEQAERERVRAEADRRREREEEEALEKARYIHEC